MAIGDVPFPVDQQWITRLVHWHNNELPDLRTLLDHYEGAQKLPYMHPELVDPLDERVRQVVINWPSLVVDALEERIATSSPGPCASWLQLLPFTPALSGPPRPGGW